MDWISLIIAIIAAIIAVVAIILNFTTGQGSQGPTGPIGPTGTSTGTSLLAYGNFTCKGDSITVTNATSKSYLNIPVATESSNLDVNSSTGIITVKTTSKSYCIIEGNNSIFPDKTAIVDLNFSTLLKINTGDGAKTVVNTVNTYNLGTYDFNTYLNMGYSWSGTLPANSTISLSTDIYATVVGDNANVGVGNGAYINISCFAI